MTNRVSYPPQDFERMCKQAERDQESRKLLLLMERVKRQIAEREGAVPKPQVSSSTEAALRLPSRSAPFER